MIANTGKVQEDGYRCGLETWYRNSPPESGSEANVFSSGSHYG